MRGYALSLDPAEPIAEVLEYVGPYAIVMTTEGRRVLTTRDKVGIVS